MCFRIQGTNSSVVQSPQVNHETPRRSKIVSVALAAIASFVSFLLLPFEGAAIATLFTWTILTILICRGSKSSPNTTNQVATQALAGAPTVPSSTSAEPNQTYTGRQQTPPVSLPVASSPPPAPPVGMSSPEAISPVRQEVRSLTPPRAHPDSPKSVRSAGATSTVSDTVLVEGRPGSEQPTSSPFVELGEFKESAAPQGGRTSSSVSSESPVVVDEPPTNTTTKKASRPAHKVTTAAANRKQPPKSEAPRFPVSGVSDTAAGRARKKEENKKG